MEEASEVCVACRKEGSRKGTEGYVAVIMTHSAVCLFDLGLFIPVRQKTQIPNVATTLTSAVNVNSSSVS